jgi:hypothetical protein
MVANDIRRRVMEDRAKVRAEIASALDHPASHPADSVRNKVGHLKCGFIRRLRHEAKLDGKLNVSLARNENAELRLQ